MSAAAIVFFTIFCTIRLPSVVSDATAVDECRGRRIHIRRLPPRFNRDLLARCSSHHPLYNDFCHHLANHGLARLTHNTSRSWYRTHPSMLELIFHRRMLDYPCLASHPSLADAIFLPYYASLADAIFLPYYASLDSLPYLYGPSLNSSSSHGLPLHRFLALHDSPHLWRRLHGLDHFLVMARPAWDFSRPPLPPSPTAWGTSFLQIPEFLNVTALTLEARAWPWQERAVPYPTSFHPPNLASFQSWVRRVSRSRRRKLVLFAGGGGVSAAPNIRRSIREECEERVDLCEIVDCSNEVCEGDPIRYMKPMLESVFCLQPPGDTPTRRSTFDAILAGCIPVFFEDLSAREQYKWHLPWSEYPEFSVSIPKEDVVFKGVRILETLLGVPEGRVRRMRAKVVELMPRILYRRHGRSSWPQVEKDAFDIAVEGTLERIRSRIDHASTHGF